MCFTFKATLNGMDSIMNVLKYFREKKVNLECIDGYCGTLIENFEVEKTFFTAVEVTAGNRLKFQLVFLYILIILIFKHIFLHFCSVLPMDHSSCIWAQFSRIIWLA